MTTLRRRLAAWLEPPPKPARKKYCLRVDTNLVTLYEVETERVMSTVIKHSRERWGLEGGADSFLTAKAACKEMLKLYAIELDDVEFDGQYLTENGF